MKQDDIMKMMTRTLMMAAALTLSPAALAQDGHNDHDGHNHGAPAAPAPIVEGTFTQVGSDHVIGRADAPATLMVFASVTCPHCADWFENQWPDVKRDLVETGRAKVIFREFPTPPMQIAVGGFLLADCGPEDTYFEAIEWQMANQTRIRRQMIDGQVKETHIEIGKAAGLNPDAVEACLMDRAGFAKLNEAVMRARSAGLKSVPAMMINGKLYDSKDVSAAALSTAIARASLAP